MTKVIIIIGKTGSGKSTLANVLSGTDKFRESGSSISVTKNIQKEEFFESGINYAVIDTVGIGDTQLKKEKVLDKIAEAVYLARKGVSQILFAVIGRLDQYEMSIYNLLKVVIFDEKVTDHTTIVRTNFVDFRNKKKCKEDIDLMIEKGGDKLLEAIKSCQERVIHVDNPSADTDDEDESEMNGGDRKASRKKILNHLKETCCKDYKPEKLQKLSDEIVEFMERKIESKKRLAEKKKLEEVKKEEELKAIGNQIPTVKKSKNESENTSLEDAKDIKNNETNSITEVAEKRREQVNNNQGLEGSENNLKKMFIKLNIANLEKETKELEETKKLIEEIQEAERFIRQKVLSHILHNYNDITQVAGGNIFLNSIVEDSNSLSTNKLTLVELEKKVEKSEKELQEKGSNDQSLDEIKTELNKKKQELLDLKKQLLEDEEISREWQKQGFSIHQAQEWADALGSNFSPEDDIEFCTWLRDNKRLTIKKIKELIHSSHGHDRFEKLKEEYRQKISKEEKKQAQEWLDANYPQEIREDVKELDIYGESLEGVLRLEGFVNLKKLNCSWNNLIDLDLSDCGQLTTLSCYVTPLTNTNFLLTLPNPGKLTNLDIGDNNFAEQDLSFLAPFVNLENLKLWTVEEGRINKGIYNRFYGSLEPLKNMSKLKMLGIANTDIDSGLEYLPSNVVVIPSLERMHHTSGRKIGKRSEAKVNKIQEQLKPFNHNYQNWRKANQELVEVVQRETEKANLDPAPEESLQEQIKSKKDYLENLTNSVKDKLKSKSKFSDAKRKERNEKLELFFKKFPSSEEELIKKLENIKEGLSKKLTEEEIDRICQTQIELTKLQTGLERLQEQQAQIEKVSK